MIEGIGAYVAFIALLATVAWSVGCGQAHACSDEGRCTVESEPYRERLELRNESEAERQIEADQGDRNTWETYEDFR